MPTAVDAKAKDTPKDIKEDTGVDTTNGKAEKKPPAEPRSTAYVVFATRDNVDDIDPLDASWEGVGEYVIQGNGGQRASRLAALADPENDDLKQAVLNGETISFFCVPKQSFQPQAIHLDAPAEPKIIVEMTDEAPVFRPPPRFYASAAAALAAITLMLIGFLTILDWLSVIEFKGVC